MKANAHLKIIDEKTIKEIVQKLDELEKLIEPYVTPLTPHERRDLPKMGPKTLAFVEKCHEFAAANPNLRPPFLNMDEFAIDFADAHSLYLPVNKAAQLHENLADTQICAGSEAFQAALIFYNTVKSAAASNVPGAHAVYEELRKRFPHNRRHEQNSDEQGTGNGE